MASAFRIHQRHTPLVTLPNLSYSIKPLVRTIVLAFSLPAVPPHPPTGPSHARNKLSPRRPAHPAQLFLSPTTRRPARRTHRSSVRIPSNPLLALLSPRSHLPRFRLPRFHLPSFFPCIYATLATIQLSQHKTQPVPHIQLTHSCASRAQPSRLRIRPPLALSCDILPYPAMPCVPAVVAARAGARRAGLDCLRAASRGTLRRGCAPR